MRKKPAFTLVELMVVIIILGILTAAAFLSYVDVTRSYRESIARTNLKVLKSASQVYRLEHYGEFPTKLLSDSSSKDGLESYLDEEMVKVLSDPDHPYQYSLKKVSGNLIIAVKGPNSFEAEIIVSK